MLARLNVCENIYCAYLKAIIRIVTLNKIKGCKTGAEILVLSADSLLFFIFKWMCWQKRKRKKHFFHPSSFFLLCSSVCLISLCCNSCQISSASYVFFFWEIWVSSLKHLQFGLAACHCMTSAPEHKDRTQFLYIYISAFHDPCTSVTSERADHDVSRLVAHISIRSHQVGQLRPASGGNRRERGRLH